jgi:hypothetical protein
MSVKLTVTIKQNGSEILYPLADRPVRITPLGTAGIVYERLVYPLHEGNFIEITDEAFEKSDCSEYATDADSLLYVEDLEEGDTESTSSLMPERWHVERNEFGNYLVFDADEEAACRIVDRIEESGLGVRRWDISSREADDGYQYDWFIRLEFNGSREECVRRVEEALESSDLTSTVEHTDTGLADVVGDPIGSIDSEPVLQEAAPNNGEAVLRGALLRHFAPLIEAAESAVRRAEVAEGELAEAKKECLALKATQKSLKESLASEQAAHAQASKRLADAQSYAAKSEAEARALRETVANNSVLNSEVTRREADLRASLHQAEHKRDTIAAELKQAREQLQSASETININNARIQDLEIDRQAANERADIAGQQLAQAARQEITRATEKSHPTKRNRREHSLEALLRRVWSRLVIHPDAIATLISDFPQWKKVFRVLSDLNEKNTNLRHEPFGNHEVFEVRDHIPTGRDPMGRIYFRRLPKDMLWIFIHRKKDDHEQERFVRKIAGYSLTQADVGI